MWLLENVIRKGFQFLPDDCVAAVKVCVAAVKVCVAAVKVAVAAYRRRKQRINYQSVGTRSRVTRRGRRSCVPRKYLYVAFEASVVQQLRPRYRLLDAVAELFVW